MKGEKRKRKEGKGERKMEEVKEGRKKGKRAERKISYTITKTANGPK